MENLEDYLETYHEIVSRIEWQLHKEEGFAYEIYNDKGRGGMWMLAKKITDTFTEKHKATDWNEADFFDEIKLIWDSFAKEYYDNK
jgi:hypothetical protein